MRPLAALSVALLVACGRAAPPQPTAFQRELQERLIKAQPGETVEIPAGRHELTRTLSLTGKSRTRRVHQCSDGLEDGHFPGRGKFHWIAVKTHNKVLFHRCIF